MDIYLYEQGQRHIERWSRQFVAAVPRNRRRMPMGGRLSPAQVVQFIRRAATAVGNPTGQLIFGVGHGGAIPGGAMVDLAPHRRFRVERWLAFYNIGANECEVTDGLMDKGRSRKKKGQ
jgi:hypothetical protein